jgi:putative exosortase-associated protein (TIGR04073 family)
MPRILRTILLCAAALQFAGASLAAALPSDRSFTNPTPAPNPNAPPLDYGDAVKLKLGSGLSNLTMGLVEVPKNIILTSNQVNLLFGWTGGVIKGTAHALGRTLSGIVDLFTAPLGNRPIPNPPFPWDNWYTDTTYGPFFPIDRKKPAPIAGRTAPAAPMSRPLPPPPPRAPYSETTTY